ncbi:MAG: sialate O-acetylesterase [Massilibacteroides sp.]|nr:sialate O-acetylesterase [Massilibacteroides sp.]
MKNSFFYRLVLNVSLLLCFAHWCEAEVKLPVLISDGMVLQRNQDIIIWGTADAGEIVLIKFLNKTYQTIADAGGEWKLTLSPTEAGGPYDMSVNDLRIKDILVGDLWLCSGQSNMELPIKRVLDLYASEVEEYTNSNIRYVKTPIAENYHQPQREIKEVAWQQLTPENALSFSAVCYFFAKDLYEKTKVPVGIINSSVGGSPIESWISENGLKDFPQYLHDRDLHRFDTYVENTRKLDGERRDLWNTILYKEDPGLRETPQWYDPKYDDHLWKETDLSDKTWAHDASGFVNGSFWFRKTIELSVEQVEEDAILRLGCIVDADSVFVNGSFVGTVAYQYPPRIYTVSKELLKPGKNTITIRLISYSGFPEFVDDKLYKLILKNSEIDLRKDWKYSIGTRMPALQGVGTYQQRPTGFYNAMIAPLRNNTFKGVIWYQGETNTGRPHEYYSLLTSLIRDWRCFWNNPKLPFLIVQLPNFMKVSAQPQNSNWAELRNEQKRVVQDTPNTGLAVAIDLGEWNDIHPLNKKDVGKRLSLQAQRIVYGDKTVVADGPIYQSMRIEGNRVILSFREGTDNFAPIDELKGFAIAGKDNQYKWAKARIENKHVIVWNEDIDEPVKVRYAWGDNPEGANLKNNVGLPASPFQTE